MLLVVHVWDSAVLADTFVTAQFTLFPDLSASSLSKSSVSEIKI